MHWTDTLPSSYTIETSVDGSTWSPAADGTLPKPVWARYVRVTMTRASGADRTGIRALEVTRAR